jgi:hypothetical protein
MTLGELRTELASRGAHGFDDDRLTMYVNRGRAELDSAELWPYRESSVTGTSPVAISDLGTVEMVIDSGTNTSIPYRQWSDLVNVYGDLSTAGTAFGWYLAQPGGGAREIATYPAGASIAVQYWCVPPDLVDDNDEPLSPSRYHGLIVDMAMRHVYKNSDGFGEAAQLGQEIERQLAGMRFDLLVGQVQGPEFFISAIGDDC